MRSNGYLTMIVLVASATPVLADVFLDSEFRVEVESDVQYGTGATSNGEVPLLLDLYTPSGENLPALLPAIVVVHGGAFLFGDKTDPPMAQVARTMASRGYVAVSINHRLDGDDPVAEPYFATDGIDATLTSLSDRNIFWPPGHFTDPKTGSENRARMHRAVAAATEDLDTAVGWLASVAGEYFIDPSRIAVFGESAGAITALFAVYSGRFPAASRVGAVLDRCGALFGNESWIEPGGPPLLIVHGTTDDIVPLSWAEALNARAVEVALPSRYLAFEGVGHCPRLADVTQGLSELLHIIGFSYDALDLRALENDYELIDNFDDGDDAGWERVDTTTGEPYGPGIYDLSGGSYRLRTTGAVPIETAGIVAARWPAAFEDPAYSNGYYRFRVKANTQGTSANMILRATPQFHGYEFFMNTTFGAFGIEKLEASGFTLLGSTTAPLSLGEEWIIEAGAVGTRLTMKVWRVGDSEPEEPQVDVVDDTFSTGGLALRAFASFHSAPTQVDAEFDDIRFRPAVTFPDCNENGISDLDEIADGTIADCDENGVPDACDLAEAGADENVNGLLDRCEPRFVRADSNGADGVDISDATFTLNFLFLGGPEPPCQEAADANGDRSVDISDGTYTLNFLFLGGPPPPAPFPACGLVGDGVVLSLGCEEGCAGE